MHRFLVTNNEFLKIYTVFERFLDKLYEVWNINITFVHEIALYLEYGQVFKPRHELHDFLNCVNG
jgi:hypothetical protein